MNDQDVLPDMAGYGAIPFTFFLCVICGSVLGLAFTLCGPWLAPLFGFPWNGAPSLLWSGIAGVAGALGLIAVDGARRRKKLEARVLALERALVESLGR